jgi:hypothetical protein
VNPAPRRRPDPAVVERDLQEAEQRAAREAWQDLWECGDRNRTIEDAVKRDLAERKLDAASDAYAAALADYSELEEWDAVIAKMAAK